MKNKKIILRSNFILLCLLLCMIVISCTYGKSSNIPLNKKEINSTTYYMSYADFQHTSFQDQVVNFQGKKIWFTDLKGYIPTLLLTTDKGLIVQCNDIFGMVSYSGKLRWDKNHDGGLSIFTYNNQIFFRQGLSLCSVDLNGKKILKNQFIYSSYNNGRIDFIFPLDDGKVVAQTFSRSRNDDPDEPHIPNEYNLLMMKAQESDWVWISSLNQMSQPALVTRDGNQLVIYDYSGNISFIDKTSGTILSKFSVPKVTYLCSACIDFSNNLNIAFFDKENLFHLGSVDSKGVFHWVYKCTSSFATSSFSQIAVDNSGTVYCAIGNSLLCVKNGLLAWEENILSGDDPRYITVLADGKVLVASGNFLTCYDKEGKEFSKIILKDKIYSPAVVDMNGFVYIGTGNGIYCFK